LLDRYATIFLLIQTRLSTLR